MNRRALLGAGLAAAMWAACPARAAVGGRFVPSRFSVVVRGSGRDVIMIPGLTAGRDIWNDVVAALPGYRYHLVQVAGFAGEPARGNARGPIIAGVAEELSRYIAASRLTAPAIVGHSMGGTIGMMLAARHPDQLGRLMVVDMLPQPSGLFGSTPDGAAATATLLRNLASTPGGRSFAASVMDFLGDGRQSDPNVVSRVVQELATIDLTADLRRMRAPVTVVYASPDRREQAVIDHRFAAAYGASSGIRRVRVDNSGHMIMVDQPARFRAALTAFLKR